MLVTKKFTLEKEINALFDECNEKTIAYRKTYSKMTKSVTAGVLLAQLIYWSKTMEHKEFYKTDKDFAEELGMGLYELKGAKKKLLALKLISIKRKGIPAKTYYKINRKNVVMCITRVNNLPTLVSTTLAHNSQQPSDTITENNTENTIDIDNAGKARNYTHTGNPKKIPETKIELENNEKGIEDKIIYWYTTLIANRATSGKVELTGFRKNITSALLKFSPLNLILAIKGFSEEDWQMQNNGHRGISWFFQDTERLGMYLSTFNKKRDEGFVEQVTNFLENAIGLTPELMPYIDDRGKPPE